MASYPTVGATVPGPEEFGDLLLEHVLGAGAFGIVFRATTAKHRQTVAVKFIQAGALADPHARRALFNEVLASREITHPNVLRLLYANLDPEQSLPYVVTEFADGGTLQERLEQRAGASGPHARPA